MIKHLLLLLILGISISTTSAQRVLLLERSSRSKPEKMMTGDELTFRMKGDKFWQEGVISQLRPDIQAMVINDRFIMIEEIEALRFNGSRFLNFGGLSLIAFGAGWSFFALVGYATDGDPSSSYSGFDASVTGTTVATGFLLRKLFARRKFKLNDRRRVRIVDLSF